MHGRLEKLVASCVILNYLKRTAGLAQTEKKRTRQEDKDGIHAIANKERYWQIWRRNQWEATIDKKTKQWEAWAMGYGHRAVTECQTRVGDVGLNGKMIQLFFDRAASASMQARTHAKNC